MKRRSFQRLKPIAAAATGVFLARGACADTILTFDAFPPHQGQNVPILQSFGDNAANSGPGVRVVGAGTTDISLTWQASSGAEWDYYIDSVWSAGQLDGSTVGSFHEIVFAPTDSTAAVIQSFNFHPYYNNGLNYSYDWSVQDEFGDILSSDSVAFNCDGTKNHPVNVNYQGDLGQILILHLQRTGGSDGSQNIAVDDITFAQLPVPSAPAATFLNPFLGQTNASPQILFSATIKDGSVAAVLGSIQLSLNGIGISPSVTKQGDVATIHYEAPGLLLAGTNKYILKFKDSAPTPKSYTNELDFGVVDYRNVLLSVPIVFEDFDQTPEGSLPPGWSQINYTDTSASTPTVDFGNLDSAAYATWTVVDVARFNSPFVAYSDPAAALVDYSLVLTANPASVENGAYVKDLATGRCVFGDSGYRNGRSQVMYLYTPDYDLTGKSNVYLSFHSLWEQNQDSIAGAEYSIDQGQTWLPIVYMLDGPDVLRDVNNDIDPVATFSTPGANANEAIAVYNDPADGLDKGGTYGAFIGVIPDLWPTLGPYISARVNDDPSESKRVELFRLPDADNQSAVRVRFFHAGTDSWYFGIDNFGIYSISTAQPSLTIHWSGNRVVISWPLDVAGYHLESTDNLPNGAWMPVGGVSDNSVTLTVAPGKKFFRLSL